MEERTFVIHPDDRAKGWPVATRCKEALREACAELHSDSPGIEVILRPHRRNRSLAQNRLLWFWYKLIADHINASRGEAFSDDDIHDWFRARFLSSRVVEIAGEPKRARKSTRNLTVAEFSEYLEQIDWFANEHLDLLLPRPDDLYPEAMGR